MNEDVLCACGEPLHYANAESRAKVEALIAEKGRWQLVTVAALGTWLVPRHYIALHGIHAAEVPELADRYRWQRVASGSDPPDERLFAAVELLRRTGATDFQLRYSSDEHPLIWIAVGSWGERIEVAASVDPQTPSSGFAPRPSMVASAPIANARPASPRTSTRCRSTNRCAGISGFRR